MIDTKTCCRCQLPKPKREFGFSVKRAEYNRYCKTCRSEMSKLNKEKNPIRLKNKLRKNSLLRNYNLSIAEYNTLFESQEGRCKICGKHQSLLSKPLFVDHDHVNNKVRGLLCSKCNFGLGSFDDNTKLLSMAINYLKLSL
jgi:hypothetical protein